MYSERTDNGNILLALDFYARFSYIDYRSNSLGFNLELAPVNSTPLFTNITIVHKIRSTEAI